MLCQRTTQNRHTVGKFKSVTILVKKTITKTLLFEVDLVGKHPFLDGLLYFTFECGKTTNFQRRTEWKFLTHKRKFLFDSLTLIFTPKVNESGRKRWKKIFNVTLYSSTPPKKSRKKIVVTCHQFCLHLISDKKREVQSKKKIIIVRCIFEKTPFVTFASCAHVLCFFHKTLNVFLLHFVFVVEELKKPVKQSLSCQSYWGSPFFTNCVLGIFLGVPNDYSDYGGGAGFILDCVILSAP